MPNTWPTFWCEDTGITQLRLIVACDEVCPVADDPEAKYRTRCRASVVLFEAMPAERDAERYLQWIDPDRYPDAPWPTVCEDCGTARDWKRHVSQDVWYKADGIGQWVQQDLPIGAMFDSWWMPAGPDGLSVTVVCPPGGMSSHWCVDGPASNSTSPWSRTGSPHAATLVVTPSIQTGDWHGYLGMQHPGELIEC